MQPSCSKIARSAATKNLANFALKTTNPTLLARSYDREGWPATDRKSSWIYLLSIQIGKRDDGHDAQHLTGAASACPDQFGKPLHDVSFEQDRSRRQAEIGQVFRSLRMHRATSGCSKNYAVLSHSFRASRNG